MGTQTFPAQMSDGGTPPPLGPGLEGGTSQTPQERRWQRHRRHLALAARRARPSKPPARAPPPPEPEDPEHAAFLEQLVREEDPVPHKESSRWLVAPDRRTQEDLYGARGDSVAALRMDFRDSPLFALGDSPAQQTVLGAFCLACRQFCQAHRTEPEVAGAAPATGSALADAAVRERLLERLQRWSLLFAASNTRAARADRLSLASEAFLAQLRLQSTLPRAHPRPPGLPQQTTVLHFYQTARTLVELSRCNRFRCQDRTHGHAEHLGATAADPPPEPPAAADAPFWGALGLPAHLAAVRHLLARVCAMAADLLVEPSRAEQWDEEWLEDRWREHEERRLAELVARHVIEAQVGALFAARAVPRRAGDTALRIFAGDRAQMERQETERRLRRWHEEQEEQRERADQARNRQEAAPGEAAWRRQEPENHVVQRGPSQAAKMLAVLGTAAGLSHWHEAQLALLRRRPCREFPAAALPGHVRQLRRYLRERLHIEPDNDVYLTMVEAIHRHQLAGGAREQYLARFPEQSAAVPAATLLAALFHPEHVHAIQKSFNDKSALDLFRDAEHPSRDVVDLVAFGCCFQITCDVAWLELYCVWNLDFLERCPAWLRAGRRGARRRRPVVVSLLGQWWVVTDREHVACRTGEEAAAVWLSALRWRHGDVLEDGDLSARAFAEPAAAALSEAEQAGAEAFWGGGPSPAACVPLCL